MTPNIVEAVSLEKVFKDFWRRPKTVAVRDLTLAIPKGGVYALLGPNGAGKSTFLKMILGQLYPTKGTLTVLGASPRDVDTKAQVGYMPEQLAFWGNLTAYETLMLFGKLQGLSAQDVAVRIPQLLSMTGISHATHRKVSAFSHGMRKRLGFAQALIHDPDFLILDEPTSGMDPLGCREVKDLIMMLAKRGKTVLITSHILGDIQDISDRVAIIYGGTLLAEGDLKTLLTDDDKTAFVAQGLSQDDEIRLKSCFATEKIHVEVEHPQRSLESYFIDVIEKANQTCETSGALAGEKVADYLHASSLDNLIRKESLPAEDEAQKMTILPENLVKNTTVNNEESAEQSKINTDLLDQFTKK